MENRTEDRRTPPTAADVLDKLLALSRETVALSVRQKRTEAGLLTLAGKVEKLAEVVAEQQRIWTAVAAALEQKGVVLELSAETVLPEPPKPN